MYINEPRTVEAEDLQRGEVGRKLDCRRRSRIDEKLRHQVNTLLAAPVLDGDLEAWTLRAPASSNFARAGGSAGVAMRRAFSRAVKYLSDRLGNDPAAWQWGKLHTLEIDSLLGSTSLGYGPKPIGGDQWTVSSRHGDDFHASAGPSWRMLVDWGARTAEAIYPGGQSEDFRSPWFSNFVQTWWTNGYAPMLDLTQAQAKQGSVTWTMKP